MYESSLSVPQGNEQTQDLYQTVADQGPLKAKHALGVIYEKGFGVSRDNIQTYDGYIQWPPGVRDPL